MNLRLKGTTALSLAACMLAAPAFADMDAAKAFLDTEIGDLSTLSRADQEAELQWFELSRNLSRTLPLSLSLSRTLSLELSNSLSNYLS